LAIWPTYSWTDPNEEALALVRTLEDEGVPYALCGALALAVHGAPRATTDIDLLVSPDAVERVVAVAKRLGFVFGAAPMGFRDGVTVHRWSKLSEGEVLTLDVLEAPPRLRADPRRPRARVAR